MSITLHYNPGAASFAVHVALNEIGIPFELALVDRSTQAHKQPAYLAMNPNGLIPVLQDGDLVLYETAAILMHLADRHPDADLIPPLATAERAEFYKWMLWLSNTLQATLINYFYPERMVAAGNADGAAQVKAAAEAKVGACLVQLNDQLGRSGGPWLLGAHPTVADPLAFMLCRWTRNFTSRPAREYTRVLPYLQRMRERVAVQRAFEREGLSAPWF